VWVCRLAERFWAAVGPPPPFPRDLGGVLGWLPTVHVIDVPDLTVARAAAHFTRHRIPCPALAYDRPLAGCFGGHDGIGVILLDAHLKPAERRFTLAHETAHYLRDYDAPRRQVRERLGARAVEVLDGLRPPTADERLAGVLAEVSVACPAQFLDRDRRGRASTPAGREAEAAADRLAYELLAPFAAVSAGAPADGAGLVARLTSAFGLPRAEAVKYATLLLR
jgi:hypothetical protein